MNPYRNTDPSAPSPLRRPELQRTRDIQLAYLLLRLITGVNIGMHGLSRILAGPASFAASLLPEFQKTFLPSGSVYAFGLVLPWVEALLGLLLFLGLATRIALIGGSLLLIVLTFGSALHQDWSAAGSQLTYALIYASLLAFRHQNTRSLDNLRHQPSQTP